MFRPHFRTAAVQPHLAHMKLRGVQSIRKAVANRQWLIVGWSSAAYGQRQKQPCARTTQWQRNAVLGTRLQEQPRPLI